MSDAFSARLEWTGAAADFDYDTFSRDFDGQVEGKPTLALSTAPKFSGDPGRYNPEDLLVLSLALCHAQTYLAICAKSGVHVLSYVDQPSATLETVDRVTRFTGAVLRPAVRLAPGTDPARAERIHASAHRHCFVARSVDFPCAIEPTFEVADAAP